MSRPKGTAEGQATSHARHWTHRSMNDVNVASITAPACTARMAAMRPRGDADSSPVTRYVGQLGRHSPHDTHAASSSSLTASRPLDATDVTPSSRSRQGAGARQAGEALGSEL